MLTNSKYFLLWITILYCCLIIKAQRANPYLVSVANVTLLSSNRAEAILRIINTNQSFQSSPISLLLILTTDEPNNSSLNNSTDQVLLNITSLPTQVQVLEKSIPGLVQDNEYSVLLSISQTDRGIAPLQPPNRSISIMTTNVQSVSVQDDPSNCRLTISCTFAIGSNADGCMITYEEINSTNTSSTNTLFISRDTNGQSSSSSSIIVSDNDYQSLLRNEMYTVEAYGVSASGERLDTIEASSVFELNGTIITCQGPTEGNSKGVGRILGIAVPPLLLALIVGAILTACVAVLLITARKRRREKQKFEEEQALRNHSCLCIHHYYEKRPGDEEERGEEGEGKKEGEERDSPKPEYIEVLPDNQSLQSLNYETHNVSSLPSSSHSQEEEEEECTYENIGVSVSRRTTPKTPPKTTPTVPIPKKLPSQNGGMTHNPTPPHLIKQSSLGAKSRNSVATNISPTHNWNRRSMPATSILSEEDDDNEYVDAFSPLPTVALKRNKAYNSMEILPS